jgi:dual oxidase
MTGCTGWLLVVVLVVFYSFAMPIVQSRGKAYFKAVHTTLYPVIMLLIILHGAGMLVQEPQFYIYFLPPAILFMIDRLIQISHTGYYAGIHQDTEVLKYSPPVIKLILNKPFGWSYKAGQHARISCPAAQVGRNIIGAAGDKFRPFTISSAPTETTVSFHIEVHPVATGGSGWTVNLMEVIQRTQKLGQAFPPVLIDGPYGGTHQHYDEDNTALVLLASGIGMTPFASIVKDLLFKIKVGKAVGRPLNLKRVYMLWSVRELKQTSWFLSALREIDEIDVDSIVKPLMFVSRSGGKNDLKLAPLYILEKWLGKHESPEGHKEGEREHIKTFLTGTRFRIHFERMPMLNLIQKISTEFDPSKVGIYACGGPGFLAGLRTAYGKAGRPFGQLHDEPFY